MSEITPMVEGGVWLAEGSGQAQYVVNLDHVARLLASGYQPVADPRLPIEEPAEQPPQGQEKQS